MKFHDEEIIGLYHHNKKLTIMLHSKSIELEGVEHWEFSSFDCQNIIFEINFFNIEETPKSIFFEYDWLKNYQSTTHLKLMEIESSVGLRGVVIFEKLVII